MRVQRASTLRARALRAHRRVCAFTVIAIAALLAASIASGCRQRPNDDAVAAETLSDEEQIGAFEEEKELAGGVTADGSSTVAPLATIAAELFRKQHPNVRVTVGISGTGGGFERFCRGETDLSNASRPIEEDERELCRKRGIEFVELQVANDGLSVVVNPANDWADCLTIGQLKRIWEPRSNVRTWNAIDEDFPGQRLSLFGAGTDSGTFDYFTEAIVGEEGESRTDYNATENDNVIVSGVAGSKGALGYVGLSYVEEAKRRVKAVEIDGGDGYVAPSAKTVQDGSYKPLSRPLLVYVKKAALARPEVEAFVTFMLDNERRLAERALFVPLTTEQIDRARTKLENAAIDA